MHLIEAMDHVSKVCITFCDKTRTTNADWGCFSMELLVKSVSYFSKDEMTDVWIRLLGETAFKGANIQIDETKENCIRQEKLEVAMALAVVAVAAVAATLRMPEAKKIQDE